MKVTLYMNPDTKLSKNERQRPDFRAMNSFSYTEKIEISMVVFPEEFLLMSIISVRERSEISPIYLYLGAK